MKYLIILLSLLLSVTIARAASDFSDPKTAHAESARATGGRLSRDQVDEEIMFQLYRLLRDTRYPIQHDALLARVCKLTEVSGWHMSSSRTINKLFYDLPLFGSPSERYKLMLIVTTGEKPSDMIISSAKIAVVVKHGYFIKEDIE